MNAFDTLMFLVFFVPLAVMVAMNLVLYREARYTIAPPLPRMRARAETAAQMPQIDLRKAA